MTEREIEILNLIKQDPAISQQELAKRLNITRSSVAVHISNLMKKGKILGKGYILPSDESVCVVGAVNVDIIATSYDDLVGHDSNPGFVKYSLGGVGRNIAENLSRLGQNVEMITIIGDDVYADQIVKDCNNLGISVRHSLKMQNQNTSVYLCLNDSDGEMNLAISAMSIYDYLTPDYLESKLNVINRSKVLVLDTNISQEAIEYLVNNVTIPIFVDPVSTKKALKIKPYLSKLHTIKPNLLEAELLLDRAISSDDDIISAASEFIKLGIKQVFISLGDRGVYYSDGCNCGFRNNELCNIVNTTGCGDAFMAGVVYSYLKELSMENTVLNGLRASKICIESNEAVSKEMCNEKLIGGK